MLLLGSLIVCIINERTDRVGKRHNLASGTNTGRGVVSILPPAIVALLGLLILSIEDIRQREVSEKHVALLLLAVAIADIVFRPWRVPAILPIELYLVLNSLLLLGVAAAAIIGTLGWGDVAVMAVMFVASPTVAKPGSLLPSLMVALFYYLSFMLIYIIYNIVSNVVFARRELQAIPDKKIRIIYAMMAKPKTAKEIVKNPGWWYPLNLCGDYKIRFNLYLDPPDIARLVKKAIDKGCLKKDDKLWVTYGIPAIPILTLSYAISITIGDAPLLEIMIKLIY